MAKRKRYTDEFRANIVLMLEAAGYPNKKGALMEVSNASGVPHPTISRWARNVQNPPPDKLVHEKKVELKDLLEAELRAIYEEMPTARPEPAG